MRNEHHIYIHKNGKEGTTPLTAESPPAQQSSAASPKLSNKGKVLLGYSALLAKRSYSTITEEIRAGGNEDVATALSNATNLVSIVGAIAATKGLAIIPLAINEGLQTVSNIRSTSRSNYQKEIKKGLKGQRVHYNQGRIYHD
jgi:hypothetical protein